MDSFETPCSDVCDKPTSSGVVRRAVVLGGLGMAATPLAGCAVRTGGFRYRLSLEIESLGRRVVGSSVQGLASYSGTSELGSRRSTSGGLVGEGAVVDLGDQGVVVSTFLSVLVSEGQGLREPSGQHLIIKHDWQILTPFGRGLALPTRPDEPEAATWTDALLDMKTSPAFDVRPDELPLIVHFPDRTDPVGVRWFSPFSDGGGLALRSATLQVVSEPLTRGAVRGALPWAEAYRKQWFALNGEMGTRQNRSLAEAISVSDLWKSRR